MADLSPRVARRTIEDAIQSTLRLAYGFRAPVVATVAALRALTSTNIPEASLRYLTAKGFVYQWYRYSSATDDGDLVIKPTDVDTSKPGRWIQTTSTIQTGYAKAVRLYNGEGTDEAALTQLIAQRPAFMIVWTGARNKSQNTVPGILYWNINTFDIWALSANLRSGAEGLEGSSVTAEATADPGVIAMIGDAKLALAGSDLSTTGVFATYILDEAQIANDQSQRTFIEKIAIEVWAAVQYPDSGVTALGDFSIDYDLVDNPPGDTPSLESDLLTSGYTIAIGSGLTKTPAAGTAYVGTTLVSSSPVSHTFGASKYIYRDLKTDGTFTYSEVEIGAAAPSQAASTLRVGVTVTDASGVVLDRILCDSNIVFSSGNIVS